MAAYLGCVGSDGLFVHSSLNIGGLGSARASENGSGFPALRADAWHLRELIADGDADREGCGVSLNLNGRNGRLPEAIMQENPSAHMSDAHRRVARSCSGAM